MDKCNLGVSKLGQSVKKPYLYVADGTGLTVIAQLRVGESEFWERLGKSLNIKFIQGKR